MASSGPKWFWSRARKEAWAREQEQKCLRERTRASLAANERRRSAETYPSQTTGDLSNPLNPLSTFSPLNPLYSSTLAPSGGGSRCDTYSSDTGSSSSSSDSGGGGGGGCE